VHGQVLAKEEPSLASCERVAQVGSRVRFLDESAGDVEQVTIVPTAEADYACGLIASDSPVAKALLGHAAGEPVRARTPGGVRRLRIMAIEAGI
jgi:transcription elongation GreA/GreB family factor